MQVIGVGAQVARAGEGNGRCRLLCATAMKEEGGGGAASFVVPVVAHLTTGSEWFDAVPWGVILRRTGTGERQTLFAVRWDGHWSESDAVHTMLCSGEVDEEKMLAGSDGIQPTASPRLSFWRGDAAGTGLSWLAAALVNPCFKCWPNWATGGGRRGARSGKPGSGGIVQTQKRGWLFRERIDSGVCPHPRTTKTAKGENEIKGPGRSRLDHHPDFEFRGTRYLSYHVV